jgi:hydrogenase maturation protease
MSRGGAPGTLYVVEPELDDAEGDAVIADAHGMNLPVVFRAVRELGGTLPRMLVVGCEPRAVEPGIGLSEQVERAVVEAEVLIRELIEKEIRS